MKDAVFRPNVIGLLSGCCKNHHYPFSPFMRPMKLIYQSFLSIDVIAYYIQIPYVPRCIIRIITMTVGILYTCVFFILSHY